MEHFSKSIYPMKIKFFLENNLTLVTLSFPLFFEYLIDFTLAICKWVKPEPLKERFPKLILAIFSISDPLKGVTLNNITNCGRCSICPSVLVVIQRGCGTRGSKNCQKEHFLLFFDSSTP